MSKIIEEHNRLQTEIELTSPPSPKRPRTHCTMTNNHNGETRFDVQEVLAFQKTTDFPSTKNTIQNDLVLVCTAENVDGDEKPYKQLQDTKLYITPITKATTSCTEDADRLSSKVCVITSERYIVHLRKDEQPQCTESDKLSSYLPDEVGKALVESHTSKDTSTDTSSHADCKWLGKSLQRKALVGCYFFNGNDKDGNQVQHSASQIQALTLSSSDEEVRCQCDCSHENMLHDAGFCDTCSQYDEVEVSYQKMAEHKVSENMLFSKKEEKGNMPVSCSHCTDCKLNNSYPEREHTGNIVEDLKNEEKLLQLQICEYENVVICDGETKGQVNENVMSENLHSVGECGECSMVPYDIVLPRRNATENVSFEIDDLFGVKRMHAAGKMIAKAWNEMADHTTEAPISARISQEPAKGDNNAGRFSVIDPAIWSETDREAGEKHCNSASTAGVELSPSIKVCRMETPPLLCFDVRPSQEVSSLNQIRQFNHQRTAQQCKDENEDLCQSYTEPEVCSFTTIEAHMAGSPGSISCSPANLPSAEEEGQEYHSTLGLQLKEQDRSDSFPISLDNLRTQLAEQSQTEFFRMDGTTTTKESKDMTSFEEKKSDEHVKLEKVVELGEECLHQNELHKENTACDCMSNYIEGETGECDERLTCVKDKKFECFSDHSYSADVLTTVETTVEERRKEGTDVEEEMKNDRIKNTEIVLKSQDDLRQQNEHKTDTMQVSHKECMREWSEENMSTSGSQLTLVSQHELGNILTSCPDQQHRDVTCMVENILDDHVALTSPPTSDAVVPCQNVLSHSQNANSPTNQNSSGRFSPVPSAFTLYNRVPSRFDTFEKIRLSPDEDDDYKAGLSNTYFLTSLPGHLLKTPQQQLTHSVSGAESDGDDQEPEEEEEEVEGECHMPNGFLNSGKSCNDLPNFTSAADVIVLGWPEQEPNSKSMHYSCEPIHGYLNTQSKFSTAFTENDSPTSDMNMYPEFEMKKQFGMVLKELNMFFDISISDFASDRASLHPITEPLGADSNCKELLSSPDIGCNKNTSTEPREMEQRRKTWSPSFMCQPLLEQLSYKQHKRLEPLRTCTRPIRVGLSKRARTKHLHRPHPYK
ncbi:uncharacterized protein LOC113149492 isoform X2 [Anabas testudineus]|uniref:uncharacterized protein LOC113149492 isoform X2 n=1 Tax=Anabas testudineus TaxID=64144 RepID=UPI000E462765|nr:uncharacterized protein LOC113149492 isoform X2 [Anabas testudineus]